MNNAFEVAHPLSFLNKVIGTRSLQYKSATWLKSAFEEHVWKGEINGWRLAIDFNVQLNDSLLLTHHRHERLLELFKCWLCIQDHFDATGGKLLGERTVYGRLTRTLHLIDYFLLNAETINLAAHGLEAFSANDMRGLLVRLASSNMISSSLYDWPGQLRSFLLANIELTPSDRFAEILQKHPFLADDIPQDTESGLNLSESEICYARAWLWDEGFYNFQIDDHSRNIPNSEALSAVIYRNTLWGRRPKPALDELIIRSGPRYSRREYPAVPVATVDDCRSYDFQFENYKGSLRLLGLLKEIGLAVPDEAVESLDSHALQSLDLKGSGRYRNVPQDVVLSALGHAIEFSLSYGDALVESYLAVVDAAALEHQSCFLYANRNDIRPLLRKELRLLGVSEWTIGDKRKKGYHDKLRANQGLWELLLVLYGSVHICVGTLMARRHDELMDLVPFECLEESETHLIFFNRKSGVAGLRDKEPRPIPAIGCRLIKQLQNLQKGLKQRGIIQNYSSLFSPPNLTKSGLRRPYHSVSAQSLDYFCDYFQTPIDSEGRRYYIRQHQLRRFFAMLFFWGNSYGRMDTLRWFLGHTDLQHLYHYITESVPGAVLRSVKAQYAGTLVRAHEKDVGVSALEDLLADHYGTRTFSILDSDELDLYIEELLLEGKVEIAPDFFSTPEGQQFRVLIHTTPKSSSL